MKIRIIGYILLVVAVLNTDMLAFAYRDLSWFINSTNREDNNLPRAFYQRGLARFFIDDVEGACIDWNYSAEKGFNESLLLIKKNCDIISSNSIEVNNN